jgi:hypothetical protein
MKTTRPVFESFDAFLDNLNMSIFEAIDPGDTLSDVRAVTGFAGATNTNTTNVSALDDFKKGLKGYTVEGDISETTALIKIEKRGGGKTISNWKIGPKTQTEKNYLKVGDVILNGDSGDLAIITITTNDLLTKSVEASGNGIYALGRALVLRMEKAAGFTNENKIVIGLNAKTANSFYANANTAFQNPIGDFSEGAVSSFIISKAVIPSEANTRTNVVLYKKLAKEGLDAANFINTAAIPNLANEYFDELKKVSKIDAASFIETIKNKNIKSYTPELNKYVTKYVDTFFSPFLTAYVERFKTFLTKKADEAGISSTIFRDLFAYIDKWKTSQVEEKSDYRSAVVTEIENLFKQDTSGKAIGVLAASASGKVIKGTEGKIGQ